jgi:hypothetical protein
MAGKNPPPKLRDELKINESDLFDALEELPIDEKPTEFEELSRFQQSLPEDFKPLLDTTFGTSDRYDTTLEEIIKDLKGSCAVKMDCAQFVAIVDSVFRKRGLSEKFAVSILGKHDCSFKKHAIYIGPGLLVYELLQRFVDCDARGQWVIKLPGSDLYLGMHTRPRVLSLVQWAALATHSLAKWLSIVGCHRRMALRLLLEMRGESGRYTILMLPRECYNALMVVYDCDSSMIDFATAVDEWVLVTEHHKHLDQYLKWLLSHPTAEWASCLNGMPELE